MSINFLGRHKPARDAQGNTEQEVHDLFFEWLDTQCEVPQLFDSLPEITYSDLVAFYSQEYGGEFYSDLVFAEWHREIYLRKP